MIQKLNQLLRITNTIDLILHRLHEMWLVLSNHIQSIVCDSLLNLSEILGIKGQMVSVIDCVVLGPRLLQPKRHFLSLCNYIFV